MTIRSVEAIPLEYSLDSDSEYGDSRGYVDARTTTLVKLITGDGEIGWGEAFGPPATISALIEDLFADAVKGTTPWESEQLVDRVYRGDIGAYHFSRDPLVLTALSGIEIAHWDLRGKTVGKPVRTLLGGTTRESVTPYASTMYYGESPEHACQNAIEDGFPALKIKVGRDIESDVRRVRTAREVIGDERALMVDYNGNYTPTEAVEAIHALDPYDIMWVEEPILPGNSKGYHYIRDHVDVPLAAGEAHIGRFASTDLIQDGFIDILQPNITRCGGFSEAAYIAKAATTRDILVRPHVWNSAVGIAAALQFAATVPCYPFSSVDESQPFFFEYDRGTNPLQTELIEQPFDPSNGELSIPDGPGLGIEVDSTAIETHRSE